MNNEENLYGIDKDEFEQITNITEEQMKKHPDDAERILMEYCHMMLRNSLIDREDVVLLFSKRLGIPEWELFKKYHIKVDSMFPRNQNEDKFCRITRCEKWK